MATALEKKIKGMDCLHWGNGKYVPSKSGKMFYNINPAIEEVIGTVAWGGAEEVNEAVTAAKKALKRGMGENCRKPTSVTARRSLTIRWKKRMFTLICRTIYFATSNSAS